MDDMFTRAVVNDEKTFYDPSAVRDWAGFTIGADVLFRGLGPAGKILGNKAKEIVKYLTCVDSIPKYDG